MAKVTAPLLSLDARGQFGKTMVFIGWKGIKTVRAYVVPANPNTAAQAAQRAIMALLVVAWKAMSTATKAAWNLWAPYETKTMSGFNAETKAGNPLLALHAETPFAHAITNTPGDTVCNLTATLLAITSGNPVEGSAAYDFQYGTDPRNLDLSETLVWNDPNDWYDIPVTGLTNDTQYYGRIVHTAQDLPVSGLLTFTPTA